MLQNNVIYPEVLGNHSLAIHMDVHRRLKVCTPVQYQTMDGSL